MRGLALLAGICLGLSVALLPGRVGADPPETARDLGTVDEVDIPVRLPKPDAQIVVAKLPTKYVPEDDLESFVERVADTVHSPSLRVTTGNEAEGAVSDTDTGSQRRSE